MLSNHFKAKLGLLPKPNSYSEEDARKDALLVLKNTEDPQFVGFCTDFIADAGLKQALRSHFESLRLLKLSSDVSQQILGKRHVARGDDSKCFDSGVDIRLRDTLPRIIHLPSPTCSQDMKSLAPSVIRQTRKDIERDRLIMNGKLFVGAEEGVLAIEQQLCALVDHVLIDHDPRLLQSTTYDNGSVIDSGDVSTFTGVEQLLKDLVQRCLAKASRTNSGGGAFMALQPLLNPETEQAVPLSELATPICVRVVIGALPSGRSDSDVAFEVDCTALALVCNVDCDTYFRVQSMESFSIDAPEQKGRSVEDSSYCLKLSFTDSVYVTIEENRMGSHVKEGSPCVRIELHDEDLVVE